MLNIVLHEPEIPQNTGNIARTCAATGARLHLIKPMGFVINDRNVKRAGLDYWHLVDLVIYDNLADFYAKNPGAEIYMSTTKAKKLYTELKYKDGDYIMFGKETKGLPESMIFSDMEHAIKIPMISEARSLNLANSVAIVLYEAIRQIGIKLS